MAEPRGRRRTRTRGATVAEQLARLEARLVELEGRLARLEGGEVRVLRAGAFDGRARARPQQGPKCPGCHLVVDIPCERCPFCGLLFRAIPPSQRPVPLPRKRTAEQGTRVRGEEARKPVPARRKSRRQTGPRAGA